MDFFPFTAIQRKPNVVQRAHKRPSPDNPHFIFENKSGGIGSRRKNRLANNTIPFHAVSGKPNII